jgi:hypothetical protein
MTVSNNRISNVLSKSTASPKQVPIKPLTQSNSRSPYGEPTVMKRLPISLLPVVNRLLANRIAEVQALVKHEAMPAAKSTT